MSHAQAPDHAVHEDGPSLAERRPGWRVKLVLMLWLVGTLWALWHYSPGVQTLAAAICRGARP